MSLLRGMIVDDYRIRQPLGSGAMGEVYLAEDQGLHRKVALKILSHQHRDNAELRARFVREARAAAAISHPNVVSVYAIGEFDGRPYFAMEHLVGRDLGTIVKAEGPLDSLAAATVALDAARGLEAAAAAGLIHRDVKPTNLVRLDAGGVKVTDFGLVKPLSDAALTAQGVVVGTPDYIAPEQARGEKIDFRVDIYALGCTLFYLLVGRAPFRRGSPEEDRYLKVVARHLKDPVPDVREARPDVDGELADLVLAMMAKNPEDRPDYAETMARLQRIAARLRGEAPPPEASSPSITRPLAERPRPRRAWLWVVLALLVGAGVTWRVLRGSDAVPPLPQPPVGMLLVRDDRGKPLAFVDRVPVSHRAFAEKLPDHTFVAEDADRPVVDVSYEKAREYAQLLGRRLLYAHEWRPALDTKGFVPGGMRLWEWVDDGTTGKDRAVRGVNGGEARRKAAGDATVTFRLAADVP